MDEDEHRQVAKDQFNAVWELLDRSDRTAADDDARLVAAFTSRHHWGLAGGPEQWAVGDWQIAHVAAHLGLGDLATRFATRALERVEAEAIGGWLLASCYEGMARAAAARGDADDFGRWRAHCVTALSSVADAEDRALIESQLASIPAD